MYHADEMVNIDQIKQSADIVAVISARIELIRRGDRWVGLCPFHEEKTGSFTVMPSRQKWNCFGCGEHGDVLDFLCRYHDCDLKTACDILSPGNSSFQARKRSHKPTESQKRERLMKALAEWKEVYFDHLSDSRRQEILDWCIDNWQPWQRPEYFRLIIYSRWLWTIRKSKILLDSYRKNILEYRKKQNLYRRFKDIKTENDLIDLLIVCIESELKIKQKV